MAAESSHKVINLTIIAIIVAVVGLGGYELLHHSSTGRMMHSNNTLTTTQQSAQVTGSSSLPNKTDTSNQQLDQDVQNIQNSMNQLQQDQGTVNGDNTTQSLDTPQQ